MCRGIPSSSEPPSGAPPHALFISVAVGLFLVCFVVLLASAFAFLCRRRSNDRTSSESEYNARRQQPFPVETLPAFTYVPDSDGSGGGGGEECSVCLGAVREGEMVRRLPACMHVYHVECIDRWLAAHRTCPLCRSELDDLCGKVEVDHSVVPVLGEPPDQSSV
ncbi:hypothetical protein PR202_ga15248 [Eleusine coracana subsp. coracana]|uniref:RING-type E3 ubiquitin transferase n=1 Tax=Eleusine coracana subsp. coracana TaxID=191504 RepID=A0AAV5CIJ8_ELECO|nr:hypothetical protein QOZ80_6BG0495220 [Eleusine coracana subsp. coracana]GJM98258.1 hypothetical protein PR202_ga15248 [Eleusine coracana subsp. coracana]